MKVRKTISLMLVAVSIVVLAACAGNENSANQNAGEENSDNLVWAGWSGEEEATKPIINGMIDSFNEVSNTSVTWVGWPWGDTLQQLIIRNQGTEQLDVAQVDIGMFGALAEMDVLEDISTLIDKDILESTYVESALEVGQIDGKQLAMPWSIASIGMVYNPTLLEEVGYDTPPTTIAEFEDCMKKIKEHDPEIIPYGFSTKEETMAVDYQPWLWTFGGQIIKDGEIVLNDEKAQEATEWYKGLLDKGYIQMNITRFDARQLFAEGKMAFYDDAIMAKGIAVQNGVPEGELDARIQPMVRPVLKEGDEPQSAMWGHLLVIFKKSSNKEKAAEFIQHIISEEQALKYLENNGMPPVIESALKSQAVINDPWTSSWLDLTKSGRRLEFALESNGSELNNILVEELQRILLGNVDVPTGLEDVKTPLQASFRKN